MTKKKILILLLIVTIVSVSAVVLAGKWRSKDVYKSVKISGNYTISDDDILKIIGLSKNIQMNSGEINESEIINRLTLHPEIKSVSVRKIPPSELSIEVIEKTPLAIINFGGKLKLIDEELEMYHFDNKGKIFDLPLISGLDIKDSLMLKYGKKDDDSRLKTAIFILTSIIKESNYLGNNISEINLSDKEKLILFAGENGFPVYLPVYSSKILKNKQEQKDLEFRIKTLKQFFENIYTSEKSKNITGLDLRYSNQLILSYEEN